MADDLEMIPRRAPPRARKGLFLCALLAAAAAARAAEPAAATLLAGETIGRVLVREGGDGRYRGRARPDMDLRPGEAVLTGPDSRVEWRAGGAGRWRVGERAVWIAGETPGDAELRAGTALAAVPAGGRWRVGAADARVTLDAGVWLLTAVDNEGLKIVALDDGAASAETAGGVPDRLELRAGEIVFARPAGRGFGPIVTVFLDELLASSRLVTKFAAPLPQAERLRQQGAAQRERLALVSNAHVGGARDAEGFQVRMSGVKPEKPAEAPRRPGAGAPK